MSEESQSRTRRNAGSDRSGQWHIRCSFTFRLVNFGGTAKMKRMSFVLALLPRDRRPGVRADPGRQHQRHGEGRAGRRPSRASRSPHRALDATQTFMTEGSGEYRFLNLAPGPYKITATLSGFTTVVREDVIVAVGRSVELPLALKIATVAETITVVGESPVIDTRATGTATNFTADELAKIPTSRDPFALMRSVPGVLVDRVNIGGNETGQQSNFASKGTRPQDAVWTLDGVDITDMAATGASPTYFNYDNFEEIQVRPPARTSSSRPAASA